MGGTGQLIRRLALPCREPAMVNREDRTPPPCFPNRGMFMAWRFLPSWPTDVGETIVTCSELMSSLASCRCCVQNLNLVGLASFGGFFKNIFQDAQWFPFLVAGDLCNVSTILGASDSIDITLPDCKYVLLCVQVF